MLNLSWKASMGIVAVGTVFPLVFAIQAAYGARQTTVKALGQLKVLDICKMGRIRKL